MVNSSAIVEKHMYSGLYSINRASIHTNIRMYIIYSKSYPIWLILILLIYCNTAVICSNFRSLANDKGLNLIKACYWNKFLQEKKINNNRAPTRENWNNNPSKAYFNQLISCDFTGCFHVVALLRTFQAIYTSQLSVNMPTVMSLGRRAEQIFCHDWCCRLLHVFGFQTWKLLSPSY